MAMCPSCKFHFRTPPDEEGDHECPRCDWEPGLCQCDVELVDDESTWVEEE